MQPLTLGFLTLAILTAWCVTAAAEETARTPEALIGKSIEDVSRGKVGAALNKDIKALRSGPLLIHGNYCGIGNRSGAPPIDELDAACMRHDACTKTGKLPNCACNDRLRLEASALADDPRTPPDVKVVAASTASAMAVLICKTGASAPTSPAPVEVAPPPPPPAATDPPVTTIPAR